MKELYTLLIACLLLASLGSCQNEATEQEAVGYLMLQVGTDKTTLTKTEDTYNPKQIAVKIVNSAGKTVKETDDCTTWTEAIELPVGTYTIEASSAGFDGKTAGWDKPYYAAKETVDIKMNTNTSKEIVCKLANVLVTVEFSDDFRAAFQSAVVGVSDKSNSDNKVTFEMRQSSETGKAYFPVTDLISNLAVTNYKGELHSKKDTITGIKAQENVILRYRIASSGSSNIGVTVDDATKTYTYTIGVPVTATSTLVASANAWSTFAYLTGEVPSFADVFDQSKLEFQYKTADAAEWTKVATEITVEEKDKKFSTKLTGLTPATAYQYRLYYNNGSEEGITSNVVEFTTEEATQLPNANFDDWYCRTGKYALKTTEVWYACSENYYNTNGTFWDSSNPGTGEGIAVLVSNPLNPTQGVSSPVHTSGGKAAQLKTAVSSGYIAAASIYSGTFGKITGIPDAEINFGQPFTSRPIALKGYYQYTPQVINYVERQPEGVTIVKNETMDECSIYIALAKKTYVINNGDESTYIDFANDNNIIAYGELPSGVATSNNGFTEFNIPLKYKSLTDKPTHIILVCSASKYGDYMTGGEGSTMYLDDFELIYDGEPTIWK